jgi:AAA domain
MADLETLLIERPDRLLLTSFAELVNRPPSPWLVRGFLRETSVGLIYGSRGSYKSFIVLDMATCLGAGIPWQGHGIAEPGLVIYVAAEGGGGMVQRTRAVAARYQLAPADINVEFITEPLVMQVESDDVEILIHRIREAIGWRDAGLDPDTGHTYDHPVAREWPALIVVDTLAQCFRGEENNSEDMGLFVQAVNRLKIEFACSLLIVHHSGRDNAHERGHSNLPGACDTIYRVDAADDSDAILVTCEKMKDSAEGSPLELVHRTVDVERRPCDDPDENLTSVVIESLSVIQDDREAHMLAVLAEIQPASWLDWLQVSGLPKSTFGKAVQRLRQNEKIAKENGLWAVSSL